MFLVVFLCFVIFFFFNKVVRVILLLFPVEVLSTVS